MISLYTVKLQNQSTLSLSPLKLYYMVKLVIVTFDPELTKGTLSGSIEERSMDLPPPLSRRMVLQALPRKALHLLSPGRQNSFILTLLSFFLFRTPTAY